jgi:hypothetical protein
MGQKFEHSSVPCLPKGVSSVPDTSGILTLNQGERSLTGVFIHNHWQASWHCYCQRHWFIATSASP